MDYSSLPHFCRREGSGSSRRCEDCFSLDHPFHQQLYSYIKKQSGICELTTRPLRHGSVHVEVPLADPKKAEFCKTLESEWKKFQNHDDVSMLHDIQISD